MYFSRQFFYECYRDGCDRNLLDGGKRPCVAGNQAYGTY